MVYRQNGYILWDDIPCIYPIACAPGIYPDMIPPLLPNVHPYILLYQGARYICQQENHPEIPEIASYLVARLAFIKSYYLHLISKGVMEKSPDFSKEVNKELSELAKTWHTLDLDRIEDQTLRIRTLMMKKGKEMRKERAQAE